MDDRKIKIRPFFIKCVAIEALTVGIVVLTVFIITLVSKPMKGKIKDFYKKYVLEETSVTEVLEGKDSYEV